MEFINGRRAWNWQLSDWPQFSYDSTLLARAEREFLLAAGQSFGAFSHLDIDEHHRLKIELISNEALHSAKIEGQDLDRDSLQSSVQKHFGLITDQRRIPPAEAGIAELMMAVYHHYDQALDDATLHQWHRFVTNGRTDLDDIGYYRRSPEPMQIISGALYQPKVHFEAPPSTAVPQEMTQFIHWFNDTAPTGPKPLPALTRASLCHLYFESIHPYEDGNGRIGRALSEKALAQSLGQPSLIALASTIDGNKKAYYSSLQQASCSNNTDHWLQYFTNTIKTALQQTQRSIVFLISKAKLMKRLTGQLNQRQEKCLLHIFREGPNGFTGGLSAENYRNITQTSRATASRDLADLVSKGALRKVGELKATRYYLVS